MLEDIQAMQNYGDLTMEKVVLANSESSDKVVLLVSPT